MYKNTATPANAQALTTTEKISLFFSKSKNILPQEESDPAIRKLLVALFDAGFIIDELARIGGGGELHQMWPALQKSSKLRFSSGQAATFSKSGSANSSQTLIQYLEHLHYINTKAFEKSSNEQSPESRAQHALIHSPETFFKSPSQQPIHRKINCAEGKTAIVDTSTSSSINIAEAMKGLPSGSSLSIDCAESTEENGLAIVANFSSMDPKLAEVFRAAMNGR